jgi:hypothetical protein
MKKGKTVSKHDIIREIKGINERLDYMFSGLSLLSTRLNEYVDFSTNAKKFVKYLKKKYGDTIEE